MCSGNLPPIRKISTLLILVIFVFHGEGIRAQDYGWWNTLVQWDGRSHWSEYMIYTPKYFGPNAIPVPEIKDGKLVNSAVSSIGGVFHFSEGDDAQNLSASIYIPITKNRIGMKFYFIPLEFYQMTDVERDIRFARDFDGQGHAIGDLHVSTWVQLTKPEAKLDLLLSVNLKTASGSNREATRFTDGTGYSFDISAGKDFLLEGEETYIRPHAQIGLYVWETNEDKNPQNDAFSYGLGFGLNHRSISLDAQLGGYVGYKGNGDKPMVTRIKFNKKVTDDFMISLGSTFGFNDFLYDSYSFTLSKSW